MRKKELQKYSFSKPFQIPALEQESFLQLRKQKQKLVSAVEAFRCIKYAKIKQKQRSCLGKLVFLLIKKRQAHYKSLSLSFYNTSNYELARPTLQQTLRAAAQES